MNQIAGIRKMLGLVALCLSLALEGSFAGAEPAEPMSASPVETAHAAAVTGCPDATNGDCSLSDTDEEINAATEIVPYAPESIQFGEDLSVSVIWPEGWQRAEIHLKKAGGIMLDQLYCSYDADLPTNSSSWTVHGNTILSARLAPESTIYLEFFWYDSENHESQHLTVPVQVTGEIPEEPTVHEAPVAVCPGENIHLAGNAGSADRITLVWSDGDPSDWIDLPVQNGTWSWDGSCTRTQSFSFEIHGHKGTLSTGMKSLSIYVYDPDTAPPAPVLELPDVIDSSYVRIHLIPGMPPESSESPSMDWHILELRRNEDAAFSSVTSYREDGSLFRNLWYDYAEEVTLSVIYLINDVPSMPTTVSYSVPGPPRPVNGPIPMNLEIPETWPAGQDLTICWKPVAEGQQLSLDFYNSSRRILSTTVTDGESILIPGRYLIPDQYTLIFWSYADLYEDSSARYSFQVSANSSQPMGPAMTLDPPAPNNTNHITFIMDQVYDELVVELYQVYGDYMYYPKATLTGSHTDRVAFQDTLTAGDWNARILAKLGSIWHQTTTVRFSVEEAVSVGPIGLDREIPEINTYWPFSIRLQPSQNATWYSVSLMYQAEEEDGTSCSGEAVHVRLELNQPAVEPINLTLKDWVNEVPAGAAYWLWVEAGADGFVTSSRGYYNLTVHDVPPPNPAPISLVVPATWPAGVDLPLKWAPLENTGRQQATLQIDRLDAVTDDRAHWYTGSYTRAEEETSITVSGYILEEGQYILTAVLEADTYDPNEVTFSLTVTANPDQPAKPVPVLASDHLYVHIPGWINLKQEYDEIYFKYVSTEGSFSRSLLSSGDYFSILAEEALTYQVYVSGRIDNVWSPVSRLIVTAEPVPKHTGIEVLRAPETFRAGKSMMLAVLWPDGWQEASITLERVGFCILYTEIRGQDIHSPSPYSYFSIQPEALSHNVVLPGDTLKLTLACLDGDSSELDSIILQIPVEGKEARILTPPASLTELGAEAFAGTNAQRIVIPTSCAAVGSKAFAESSSLVEVIIQGAATVIPADAFEGCDQTVTLWLPDGNPSAAAFGSNPNVVVAILSN